MNLSPKAKHIYCQIIPNKTKLGDLRKMAKELKTDNDLAMELWQTKTFLARQLAILIMDKKALSQSVIDLLDKDMQQHNYEEKIQLIDWLMANQLSKDKNTIMLMESWERSKSALQRRVFWYYQARLRWMGNAGQTNTEYLLTTIEKNILKEKPEVQWAMNFTAGQIGKWQKVYRQKCIAIGENTGLYKEEKVAKNCTPNYLPEFIRIEVSKLKK